MPASYMTPYMRRRRAIARGAAAPPPTMPLPRRRLAEHVHNRRGIFKPLVEHDEDGQPRNDTCVFCGLVSADVVCPFCLREIES
jgi:hypothetical protein